MKKLRKGLLIALHIVSGLLFTLGCLIFQSATWVHDVFGVRFAELLYTMTSPLKGTGDGMVGKALAGCLYPVLPWILLYIVAVLVFAWLLPKKKAPVLKIKKWKLKPLRLIHILAPVLAVCLFVSSLFHADRMLGMFEYFELLSTKTTVYEEYFVDPTAVAVEAPENKKNLILIHLESMETTYASKEDGGNQEVNLIPGMTRLAQENISFSQSENLGGFRLTGKTSWTMAALFAASSGIPFSFPIDGNSMGEHEKFASGVTALGDILLSDGYYNEFLCGSDVSFAGRKQFYQQHGDYDLYDLFTAREEGVIAPDYKVFWGFEDKILYEIAKKELLELSQKEQPFNLTMLTVDPHHTGGYVCDICGDGYAVSTANVIACADNQLTSFLDWCREQPFYENTVIVLIGDHPRMDNYLVEGVARADRTMYNCIINSDTQPQSAQTNRELSPMDMFPTILAALGYEIEGDRLGLGTNLFSGRQTLSEELGYEYLDKELYKYSTYFAENFY